MAKAGRRSGRARSVFGRGRGGGKDLCRQEGSGGEELWSRQVDRRGGRVGSAGETVRRSTMAARRWSWARSMGWDNGGSVVDAESCRDVTWVCRARWRDAGWVRWMPEQRTGLDKVGWW